MSCRERRPRRPRARAALPSAAEPPTRPSRPGRPSSSRTGRSCRRAARAAAGEGQGLGAQPDRRVHPRDRSRRSASPPPPRPTGTLIRRLRFDLTGLPPTPEEVDAFVADRRPDAYERLVDRLLACPQYGERWARLWLDLARFAESDGFKSDKTRPNAWRYRDWVVKALNADMPYDRFVALQLAGDEVAPATPRRSSRPGFNRNWPFEDNNKVPGLNRQLMLDDMTDTTASVFLGLTVGCARCHDHKYDPISQKDYYRFQALFAASAPKDDYSLASPFEQAVYASVEAEDRARVDRGQGARSTIERPYLATLLKATLAKLPRGPQGVRDRARGAVGVPGRPAPENSPRR